MYTVCVLQDFSKVPSWLLVNRSLTPDFVSADPKVNACVPVESLVLYCGWFIFICSILQCGKLLVLSFRSLQATQRPIYLYVSHVSQKKGMTKTGPQQQA